MLCLDKKRDHILYGIASAVIKDSCSQDVCKLHSRHIQSTHTHTQIVTDTICLQLISTFFGPTHLINPEYTKVKSKSRMYWI